MLYTLQKWVDTVSCLRDNGTPYKLTNKNQFKLPSWDTLSEAEAQLGSLPFCFIT